MPPHVTSDLGLDFGEERFPRNILPQDGEAIEHGVVFSSEVAERYLEVLLTEVPWRHDEARMFGKEIVTARKVAWYGDRNYDYTYSGRTRTALIWTPALREIKEVVERHSGAVYNSCLLNLYADGSQGMGWHHDDEKGLGKNSTIASVSFGATRRFDLRHNRTREKISCFLESGSLLVMQGRTQSFWQHQVPKSLKVTAPRVNLTFRRMIESETRIGERGDAGEIR
ncbi:alpha-ketoglutarate-dependent dioxygenase AlkB [Verrucomicrobiaceae bacterium 227]